MREEWQSKTRLFFLDDILGRSVAIKADASRVTLADIAISENLFASLKKISNDDYCSEEMSSKDVLRIKGDFSWHGSY